jgi:hypothetical protein
LILVAWLAAAACVSLSAWHVRRLGRYRPPSRTELRARLETPETATPDAALEDELRERAEEAERALAFATLLPRSLARISLATGTALALTSLARGIGTGATRVPAGAIEFAAGFTGMIVCTIFGRQAKVLAQELRQGWRDARKTLGRK